MRENLVKRAALLAEIRRFMEARDYLEVQTPVMVPSPGLDLHLDAFEIDGAYLITSPEYQMKRLLAEGMARIYQITPCFRRGEQGARHNREFSMLEWYRAGATMHDMMDETEQLVRSLLDLPAFERMTVADAFQRFASADMASLDEDAFFLTLVERVEPALAERPATWLYHYPASQASLARLCPNDPSVCERFELYVGDLELCNGFGELTDPVEQRRRLERDQEKRRQVGKPVYPIDERFVQALERGLPACAGNALGLDRLLMLICGASSIREVMAFSADEL